MHPALVDVDDLVSVEQIEEFLVPIKEAVPGFALTAYTVPNRMGPVHGLKIDYPWIRFAIHGFEHTFAECRAWTSDQAEYFLTTALEMGYAKFFKPPNWIYDIELEMACKELDVLLHHHPSQPPSTPGLRHFPVLGGEKYAPLHTHILKNASTDHITTHPGFAIENLKTFDTFIFPNDRAERIL